jgi:hypothetical protein
MVKLGSYVDGQKIQMVQMGLPVIAKMLMVRYFILKLFFFQTMYLRWKQHFQIQNWDLDSCRV